jgi:glycosyltransferase involved in cell wall biosynthesis
VHELPVERVGGEAFDCILFQSRLHYLEDQYEVLTEAQRRLPRIFLEHDPPLDHPTEQRHVVDDPNVLLVHVTPFNALMWDAGRTPTRVVEHGVLLPDGVRYGGELPRGITALNNLGGRGRRVGPDVFEAARREVPLDLVGIAAEQLRGLGEVSPPLLPEFMSAYRFYFNPARYTSLNLAVCEAMMVGLPVVGLATTEMATAVENGVAGFVDTRLEALVGHMRALLADPRLAARLGAGARRAARERFGIGRFARDWDETFRQVAGRGRVSAVPAVTPRPREPGGEVGHDDAQALGA